MWEQGFVAEVDHLISQGIRKGVTARRALGYAPNFGDARWRYL
jgi:tRNA A37 N6-isopentenylltransferase MiaA